MAPAADPSSSLPIPTAESNLQPFFILHKASPRKSAAKTRRRIDLSPKTSDGSTEECNDNLRLETFKFLWSNTESIIKDVLKNLNANVFDEIDKWVHVSFGAIRACRTLDFTSATCPYPILNSSSIAAAGASRQIFTALLFTKNMEFVDDILTFATLVLGGCLKTLLRQFLMVSIDAPDMSILASWYTEQENYEKPLVIIIDDVERCCGPVLNDFIIMLREWVIKIPIILILGVATTVDALRNILSSNTYLYLSVCEFTLGTPAERMDAVIEAVLLKNCESFSIGKQVSTFLRNYFLRHDGTLTLFVKALRISMVQHIYAEPLSFTVRKLGFNGESILPRETVRNRVLDLPSLPRCCQPSANYADWASGLSELKRLRKLWSSTVTCLYEVGKYRKITLLDLYCETLEPEPRNSSASDHRQLAKDKTISSHSHHLIGSLQNEGYVAWAFQIVRDLPAVELCKLLNRWEMLTIGITEIHEKVKELQSLTTCEDNRPKRDPTEASKRPTARNHINEKTDKATVNEKVATFLQCLVRQYIQPIESIPFNEIVFFNNVDKLQTVTCFVRRPRRRIQADLLESNKFLKCSCCSKNGAIVSHPPLQAKKRSRLSPSPKNEKNQAAFCRAVTELQITGLLRMPSKRRPDYVQRVAFGL
ncbi:hypothetical protein Pfo_028783 [Paulownia fortunei]|nr:hypothetical protein Pfo_028783 [Paulownia fortunei]